MKTVKTPFPSKLAGLRLGQEKHEFLGLGRFNVIESPSLRFLCPQSTLLLTERCIAALTPPEDSLEIRNLRHHLRICILTRCPGDSPAHHNWRSPALKTPGGPTPYLGCYGNCHPSASSPNIRPFPPNTVLCQTLTGALGSRRRSALSKGTSLIRIMPGTP